MGLLKWIAYVSSFTVCIPGFVCMLGLHFLNLHFVENRKRRKVRTLKDGKYKNAKLPDDCYDVIIVGAGPAGTVAAYHSAQAKLKVALLDKATFPRDKVCADVVSVRGLEVLDRLGLLKVYEEADEMTSAFSWGYLSSSGFFVEGKKPVDQVDEPLAIYCKRIYLDNRLSTHAQDAGAYLLQGYDVESATFDNETGIWTCTCNDDRIVKGRLLMCADGSMSKMGTKLGLVSSRQLSAFCSQLSAETDWHEVSLGGMMSIRPQGIPGYCAMLKHQQKTMSLYCYVSPSIPLGCATNTEETLRLLQSLQTYALKHDPMISTHIGPNPKFHQTRSLPVRRACEGVNSTYGDHVLLLGDAAGFIDPLTGMGIQNALLSGEAAAYTAIDMHRHGDFSRHSTIQYEDRWMSAFGWEFDLSFAVSNLMFQYPLLSDAIAVLMKVKGDKCMIEYGMGSVSRDILLHPFLFFQLVASSAFLLLSNAVKWR